MCGKKSIVKKWKHLKISKIKNNIKIFKIDLLRSTYLENDWVCVIYEAVKAFLIYNFFKLNQNWFFLYWSKTVKNRPNRKEKAPKCPKKFKDYYK